MDYKAVKLNNSYNQSVFKKKNFMFSSFIVVCVYLHVIVCVCVCMHMYVCMHICMFFTACQTCSRLKC